MQCLNCKYRKTTVDPGSRTIISQCFYNPPTPFLVPTNQGAAVMVVRPTVDANADFCHHYTHVGVTQ